MASGARPSSNQRSETTSSAKKTRTPRTHDCNEYCVVCGDRACNHHYYGVAACHGCKCFFWRSVKQQQQYICRYEKNCDINPNHRNACRYCRFQRCLAVGMQPDAVRMQTTRAVAEKRPASSTTNNHVSSSSSSAGSPPSSEPMTYIENNEGLKKENEFLLQAVIDLERRVNEVADFNENETAYELCSLDELFVRPEILECYRTRIVYCVRLRRATTDELEFCKFRTLTKAFDMVNSLDSLGTGQLMIEDKVKILRSIYGPLTVFDMAYGTVEATKDQSLLCLPTGITLSCNEQIQTNSFINQALLANITGTLGRTVEKADLTEEEAALIKAIILANDNVQGLSTTAIQAIDALRSRLHSALHQVCSAGRSAEAATLRFAELLHLMSKLVILSYDLIEHFRLQFTFAFAEPETRRTLLFYELFGDLFQQTRERIHIMDNVNTFTKVKNSPSAYTPTYDSSVAYTG